MLQKCLQSWIGNIILLLASLLVGALLLEGLSRLVFPLSPGSRVLTESGDPLRVDVEGGEKIPGNLRFRQVADEFDALVTTTDLGYRGPPAQGQPEIIFIGDSFTWGSGLRDEQTFAYLYCHRLDLSCANLGRGGTGTRRQLNILEDFLQTEGWRPREVMLFMLIMTSALMDGNDLVDNLAESAAKPSASAGSGGEPDAHPTGLMDRLIDARRDIFAWSNLARIVYFVWGPTIRSALSPAPPEQQLQMALDETRRQLQRFHQLAQRYDFKDTIYIVHPMQDLINGTYPQTVEAVRSIAPEDVDVISTAAAYLDNPREFFYNYNGHFNPKGAARLAEFLAKEETYSRLAGSR